jgi:hypothetical protein
MANPLKINRLNDGTILRTFDCGDEDLSDFFLNDAKNYQKQLLAVTYFEEREGKTVFFLFITQR